MAGSNLSDQLDTSEDLDSGSTATAVLPAPAAPAAPVAAVAGECCPKCATPIDTRRNSWCGRCGFYPRLGTFVELDNPEPAAAPAESEAQAAGSESLLREVPAWMWILLGGLAVLLVASIAARLLTEPESSMRMSWSVGQLGIGLLVAAVAHIACFVALMMESDQLNILDIILKPLSLWTFAVKELPHSFRRVAAGCWGAFAAFLAVAVIGGIPFSNLVDWGGKETAKVNLVHAITEQAGGKGSDQSMEEAMKSFAGESGADKLKDKKNGDKAVKRLKSVDCLIIGFVPAGDAGGNEFSALLVATVVNQRLKFVGAVSDGISPEARKELNDKMPAMIRAEPFVPCRQAAVWLEPNLVCRVKFNKWTANQQLGKPLFEKMLAQVDQEQ